MPVSEPTFDYDESSASPSGPQIRRSLEGKFVCPFCGSVNHRTDEPCVKCGMDNTPSTRNSTRGRIGPWYVLQKRNPSAPGMKFDVLVKFVAKGRINPRTIVRGPTTTQLWRFAATVKGLSREFNVCYNCGGEVDRNTINCPQCGRDQQPPADPDVLLESRSATMAAAIRPDPPTDMFADQVIAGASLDEPAVMAESSMNPSSPPRPTPRRTPPKSTSDSAGPGKPIVSPTAAAVASPKPSPFTSEPVKTTLGPSATAQRDELERREIEDARLARQAEPRDPTKPATILSARELATAFQLDFNDGRSKRRSRRRMGKGVAALLLLAIIAGGGTAAYLKLPAFRDSVDAAYAISSAKVQQWIAERYKDKTTTVKPPAARTGGDAPTANQSPTPTPIKSPSNTRVLTNPVPPAVAPTAPVGEVAAKVDSPEVKAVKLPADAPTADEELGKIDAFPAVTPSIAVPTTPTPQTPVLSGNPVLENPPTVRGKEDIYAVERKLWSQAMEAESRSDWSAAVSAYEKIQALPKEVHRSILPTRLKEARGHLAGM